MNKFSKILIGGVLIAIGSGCFLYPNFREWNTQREVERIIEKFDETYSEPDSDNNEPNATEPAVQDNHESSSDGSSDNDHQDETQQNTAGNNPAVESNSEETTAEGKHNQRYLALYNEMNKYNQELANSTQYIVDAWDYEQQPFDLSSLNVNEDDPVIGYIDIPDMKICLPLMLGASTQNLEKGAAVMYGTSMPIGGENTNCVIAGHRGWEGSAYFQYIENMKAGSKVYITNPWETLVYECKSVKVIYPDDTDSILIQPGKDMVTLLSCHPYVVGGGKYRYLVYCERVDTQQRKEATAVQNPKAEKPTEDTEDEVNGIDEGDIGITNTSSEGLSAARISNEQKVDWLALEETLRYMLPFAIIVVSVFIAITKNLVNPKKPKNKKNNKNAKKRRKKERK